MLPILPAHLHGQISGLSGSASHKQIRQFIASKLWLWLWFGYLFSLFLTDLAESVLIITPIKLYWLLLGGPPVLPSLIFYNGKILFWLISRFKFETVFMFVRIVWEIVLSFTKFISVIFVAMARSTLLSPAPYSVKTYSPLVVLLFASYTWL